MSDLKPCPNCTEQNPVIGYRKNSGCGDGTNPTDYIYAIRCENCGLTGPHSRMEDVAAAHWNALARPTPDAGLGTAERLAELLLAQADLQWHEQPLLDKDDTDEDRMIIGISKELDELLVCELKIDLYLGRKAPTVGANLVVDNDDGMTEIMLSDAFAARCRAKWAEPRKESK